MYGVGVVRSPSTTTRVVTAMFLSFWCTTTVTATVSSPVAFGREEPNRASVLADSSGTKVENCSVYSRLEQKVHCGISGYLIGYGQKYCKRFNSPEFFDAFDDVGKKFVNCTTQCLIQDTKAIVKEEQRAHHVDCEEITDDAFDSHETCYIACDFCNICKTNKAALWKAYDVTDFFATRAVKQIYRVMKQCGFWACF